MQVRRPDNMVPITPIQLHFFMPDKDLHALLIRAISGPGYSNCWTSTAAEMSIKTENRCADQC